MKIFRPNLRSILYFLIYRVKWIYHPSTRFEVESLGTKKVARWRKKKLNKSHTDNVFVQYASKALYVREL